MKTSVKEIGKRIKEIRKDEKLTQTEFGEKIGVKGNTVTGYENGTRRPSDSVLNYICLIFNIDQTWLRTGEGSKDAYTPDYINALEKLFSDKDCNNMEIKFLTSYFELKKNERKAFCELIEKMFPDAIAKIVGDNPLDEPYSSDWQECHSLRETKEVTVSATILSLKISPEMTREEIHAELDRQLDEEKEAEENASGYGHGKSDTATG